MRLLKLIICTIVVFLPSVLAQSDLMRTAVWRSVIPLRSTRKNVERVLGEALKQPCDDCIYQTDSARVFVSYSRARCKGGLGNGWNVPKDTVVNFTVYPQVAATVSTDQLRAEKFLQYSRDSFISQVKGISYSVEELSNRINRITFLPKGSDSGRRCKGFPRYNPLGSIYAPDLVIRKDQALDMFDVLITESQVRPANTLVYVVVYSGKDMNGKAFAKLLKSYQDHIYRKRGTSRDKIRLINGGTREDFGIDVFSLTNDAPPPVPSPDYPWR